MKLFLKTLFICGFLALEAETACVVPLANGSWYSSTRGNWDVNGTHIKNFSADLSILKQTAELQCERIESTNLYVLKTNFEIFFNLFIDVYTCIELIEISNNTFVYYIVTATDGNTGEQFTSENASACDNSNYRTAINRHVAVHASGVDNLGSKCPNVILGKYNVEYDTKDGTQITDVYLDVCNDTDKKLMEFNTTVVDFTANGTLTCLDYVTSGSYVYLHTHNNDQKNHRFACWVIANADNPVTSGPVEATVYPSMCVTGQTPTSTPYGGETHTFTLTSASDFCGVVPVVTEEFAGWKIALIVLGIIAAIILILGIAMSIRYACSRRQVSDEEKGIIKARASPDSILGDDIDKDRLRLDEWTLRPRKKGDREKTFDLLEIKRPEDKDLEAGPIVEKQDEESRVPIEFPPGKKPIPPTTPRPDEEDAALIRLKKERERREKERQERKKKEEEMKGDQEKKEDKPKDEQVDQVIKRVRESSPSDEYETDESEREQKLMEKRKRLAKAKYEPPEGVHDAKVVGKKKERKYRKDEETEDKVKTLKTRDQQEELDRKRLSHKKALKKMAKNKLRHSPSDVETSESEADVRSSKRRHKRRKKEKNLGRMAPYTVQYNVKKDIERELDEMDYWNENVTPTTAPDGDEDKEGTHSPKEPIQVSPMETDKPPEPPEKTGLEKIMEEEADLWTSLGMKGFQIGPNGELPEGFSFDEEGNVVRAIDGKIIPKEDFERQMNKRNRFGFVFSLPRLKRNTDGRPLGGYKDDEFGPTAEWDYGEAASNGEEEDEAKKADAQKALSERQVAFSVDDLNTAQTPLKDLDYNQLNHVKGRQLGSAERSLLKDRLFEGKGKSEAEVPVYFLDQRGGVKPESIYIENKQIARQEPARKPNTAPGKISRVVRSDTFDDGRQAKLRRLRTSWSGPGNLIPEGSELQAVEGLSRSKRNIGSDDEFILVKGSLRKLDTKSQNMPQTEKADSHFASHWCSPYERQGHLSSREPSEIESVGMRTATDTNRSSSVNDKRMKKMLQELYTDKKYFDHYLESEQLQTNAGIATRGLANHGLGYLKKEADYWAKHQPINPPAPPSELGLRLMRMRTFNTIGDSGVQSMPPSARPFSADEGSRQTTRENTVVVPRLELERANTAEPRTRNPPTVRSALATSPSQAERVTKEKTVTINETPRQQGSDKDKIKVTSSEPKDTGGNRIKNEGISEEYNLPGNVLSITEA